MLTERDFIDLGYAKKEEFDEYVDYTGEVEETVLNFSLNILDGTLLITENNFLLFCGKPNSRTDLIRILTTLDL